MIAEPSNRDEWRTHELSRMRIAELNWMQVEDYLQRDDRCVLPIGSTEQHAYLSLCVDSILAERISIEAAEALGIPVYPVLPFGCAPYFSAFPGSISLRPETLFAVIRDCVTSLRRSGFRRILIVNGHGGNSPVGGVLVDLLRDFPELTLRLHNWWTGPLTMAKARDLAPHPSHANWFENFPWTRLLGVQLPREGKPMIDNRHLHESAPDQVRQMLGDGSFGGSYQVSDEQLKELWAVGVEETRKELEASW